MWRSWKVKLSSHSFVVGAFIVAVEVVVGIVFSSVLWRVTCWQLVAGIITRFSTLFCRLLVCLVFFFLECSIYIYHGMRGKGVSLLVSWDTSATPVFCWMHVLSHACALTRCHRCSFNSSFPKNFHLIGPYIEVSHLSIFRCISHEVFLGNDFSQGGLEFHTTGGQLHFAATNTVCQIHQPPQLRPRWGDLLDESQQKPFKSLSTLIKHLKHVNHKRATKIVASDVAARRRQFPDFRCSRNAILMAILRCLSAYCNASMGHTQARLITMVESAPLNNYKRNRSDSSGSVRTPRRMQLLVCIRRSNHFLRFDCRTREKQRLVAGGV